MFETGLSFVVRLEAIRMCTIAKSLQEYARGIAGGLLFSLPLLYTMEVWHTGFTVQSWQLVTYVFVTFLLLLGYNRYAGLRRDASHTEVVIDSVDELGLGMLIAALILWLIGRIITDMAVGEIIGQVVLEAMTVAIGVSVGTAQLGGDGGEDTGSGEDANADGNEQNDVHFGGQLVIALCGAVLFAANVGPTEEITVIAVEAGSGKLLLIALLSLALSALVLFYSDFTGAKKWTRAENLRSIFTGSIITYAVALFVSAMILWFFGHFAGNALVTCVSQIVVLGLLAALGASAGRLLLQ